MSYQLQVSAKILSWPRSCACCGNLPNTQLRAAASRTTGKRVQHTTTSWWEVPYCTDCIAHKAKFEGARWWLLGGLVVGILGGVLVASSGASGAMALFIGATLTIPSFWPYTQSRRAARSMMKAPCATAGAAVRYVEWHGTFHTFMFESRAYLDHFVAGNSGKTMSDIKPV